MITNEELAEPLSRCPACCREAEEKPNPDCEFCAGAGLVSGRAYVEWQSETRQRITRH